MALNTATYTTALQAKLNAASSSDTETNLLLLAKALESFDSVVTQTYASSSAFPAASSSEGAIVYALDVNTLHYSDGSTWNEVGGSIGAGEVTLEMLDTSCYTWSNGRVLTLYNSGYGYEMCWCDAGGGYTASCNNNIYSCNANATYKTATSSVIIGYNACATGNVSVAIGCSSAAAYTSVAVGCYARATGSGSVAIGSNAGSLANCSIAIGKSACACSTGAITIMACNYLGCNINKGNIQIGSGCCNRMYGTNSCNNIQIVPCTTRSLMASGLYNVQIGATTGSTQGSGSCNVNINSPSSNVYSNCTTLINSCGSRPNGRNIYIGSNGLCCIGPGGATILNGTASGFRSHINYQQGWDMANANGFALFLGSTDTYSGPGWVLYDECPGGYTGGACFFDKFFSIKAGYSNGIMRYCLNVTMKLYDSNANDAYLLTEHCGFALYSRPDPYNPYAASGFSNLCQLCNNVIFSCNPQHLVGSANTSTPICAIIGNYSSTAQFTLCVGSAECSCSPRAHVTGYIDMLWA